MERQEGKRVEGKQELTDKNESDAKFYSLGKIVMAFDVLVFLSFGLFFYL